MFPELLSLGGNFFAAIDDAQEPNERPCATAQSTNSEPRLMGNAAGKSEPEF